MDKKIYKKDLKAAVPGVSISSCDSENVMLETTHGSLTSFNDYLCTQKAAAYLSISEATLRNLCSNGQVIYYKLGRRSRFLRSDLDSLLSRVNGKDNKYGN